MLDSDRLDAYAAGFATLGRLHREAPDDAVLGVLWSLLDDWPLPGGEDTAEGLRRWALSREAGEDADVISRDHNRLYGVSAKAVVPPYESVHRDDDGLVFDVSTLDVRAAYLDRGLQAPRLNREPDDHLGLEFDFMAQLVLWALDALEREDAAAAETELEAARQFLAAHLLQWAPGMLRKTAEAAGTRFMSGLALLSLGALESAERDFAAAG